MRKRIAFYQGEDVPPMSPPPPGLPPSVDKEEEKEKMQSTRTLCKTEEHRD
jgi:hypothetical protein